MTAAPASTPTGSVLRFENVTVRFGDNAVLKNLNLTLEEADTVVILGSAGSGKTVLLKTALGLIRPDEGSVYLFGTRTDGMREEDMVELRSRLGILFQEGGLFDSLTIEENVAYPLLNQKSLACPPEDVLPRVTEALRFVELAHTLEKVPSELSGGMRRRVGIARAIVTQPALLLYDSPTAGLDPITANTIMALIAKERDLRRTTTAIATHRYQDGQLLANYRYNGDTAGLQAVDPARDDLRTRFIVLKDGELVFEGTQAELEANTDSYISKFAKRLSE
ncbi:MAG: ATP-binding cassette domain-containing protein [Bryobacterales bacterium]|nr:ATP-binding cassette domain-containing protein [Bryobacterales bacterium]